MNLYFATGLSRKEFAMKNLRLVLRAPVVLVAGVFMAWPAVAVDLSYSGFGTVGYSRSDQPYHYQRFVDNDGTFRRDSVLGLQVDARINDQFSATVQGKVAASLKSDSATDATISWAFLSWRPSNDWLVRAGRLRVPLYLRSESTDVGTTFDFAQLPTEVYSTSPTTDVDGLAVSKTWNSAVGEWTLDGYVGSTNTTFRTYLRDNPAAGLSGRASTPVRVNARGLVLTFQQDDNLFRIGAHDVRVKTTDGQFFPVTYPFVTIAPGIGYYQVSSQMPGPGLSAVGEIHSPTYTLGADVAVGADFRLVGEYVRRNVLGVNTGSNTQGAYLAVLRPVGAWTPYVSVGRLLSKPEVRDLYGKVNTNRVPAFIPGAARINASQRAGADGLSPYDQTTWAAGTSYRLSPSSKLKAEWARTRVGLASGLIDAPPGGESGNQVVNVLSLSYSFVF
ncbi:hypothetical protein QN362_17800 [Actimicrobium sp. CCC2.4]|uniref:hypothetical protein n=1 Tax=Actimicrobium sp. CCC2.4 TaxID=3048606 RepID=UPI002AC9EFF9|nr:hypothetical protein [Actimicrobium sp. CCC2.4]MEB0137190.1 hypothetical protein [Actimicrobium sp. CCC2.4]WPX32487.1 hypothetical protein RHM62_01165 [Actimicrobium sp. CCC2.4]